MKTFHFLFTSFVKQLSHIEDFLDYCFEFQFAISATIGWPFLFLAHNDTAVRLEIFSEISFPCGIGKTALAFIWVVIPDFIIL